MRPNLAELSYTTAAAATAAASAAAAAEVKITSSSTHRRKFFHHIRSASSRISISRPSVRRRTRDRRTEPNVCILC